MSLIDNGEMIRVAINSDYSAMDAVFRSSVKQLCKGCYDDETIEAWAGKPWPERFSKSADEGNRQYVFVSGDEIICFGSINVEKSLLVGLFVEPKYSGQGVGRKMTAHLISEAKAAGVHSIHVDSSLNAVGFYKANGFSEIGRSEYTTQNGVVMKSVQMELSLRS
jgi:GNAT superfamily N-acetyltransferase